MKTINFLLMILFASTFNSFAQTNLDGRYEVGGLISYSYSSVNILGSPHKTQSISLQPKIGVFPTPALEVTLGPTVLLTFIEIGSGFAFLNGVPFPVGGTKSEDYALGITPGATYHFLLDDVFIPYLALSANLLWRRSISGSTFSVSSQRWSKPTIIAPTIDAGLRIFISKDWALRLGLTYSKTQQQTGDTSINGYSLALGTGFALFL